MNQYAALLASKDIMLTKYEEALDEKNNTIRYLKSLLAVRDLEIQTLRGEQILGNLLKEKHPLVPEVETDNNEVLVDNDSILEGSMKPSYDKPTPENPFEEIVLNNEVLGNNDYILEGSMKPSDKKPTQENPIEEISLSNEVHVDNDYILEASMKPSYNKPATDVKTVLSNEVQLDKDFILKGSITPPYERPTSEKPLDEMIPNENIQMEMVWKDGSLDVVGSLWTSEFDFSENISSDFSENVIDQSLEYKNNFQPMLNFDTDNIQLYDKEKEQESQRDPEDWFLDWKEQNKYFKQTGIKKSLSCPYPNCSKISQDGASYRKHKVTHGPKMFVCPECQRGFRENSKLMRHMVVHTGEQPYICSFGTCGKKFSLEFNLRTHIRIHTDEKPYHCTVVGCGYKFAQKTNLNSHVLSHG